MSYRTDEIILLPIHPIYADRIFNGEKRVEFRKQSFTRDVKGILLYATSPQSSIVGYIKISSVDIKAPNELWSRYHKTSGIEKSKFDEYFQGYSQGAALLIDEFYEFHKPISLSELHPSICPPRSYQYIPFSWLERIGVHY